MKKAKTMIELEQAYSLINAALTAQPMKFNGDHIPLEHSLGRVLKEDIHCRLDHPIFDQSAMDGVAFQWEPESSRLQLVGTVAAGDVPKSQRLATGQAVRIMTGAPLPTGADTVVMVEKVKIVDDVCELMSPATKGQHIRYAGENLKRGDLLAASGSRITAGIIAALASQGLANIEVKRKLRLGLATTGNEVVPVHQTLKPGQIYNTNAPALAAMLTAADVDMRQLGVLPDQLEATQASLVEQTDLDVLILTGGVSMGEFDFVPEAAQAAGFKKLFHKVAMKPGKPIWVGRHPSGTWLFGLPGNPVSALVGAALFIQPVLDACRSDDFRAPHWVSLPLVEAAVNPSRFTFFAGARLVSTEGGLQVKLVKTSGSGDVVRFGSSQTLMRLGPNASFPQGSPVEVLLPSQLVIG